MSKVLVLWGCLALSSVAVGEIFVPEEHCVAWKTRKTMALVKKVEPVGKNCQISTKLMKLPDGGFRFEGHFPLKGFNSGEKDRDESVIEILGGPKSQELVFQSKAKSREMWLEMLAAGQGDVGGYLNVAGKEFVIEPNLKVKKVGGDYLFEGVLVTEYKKFEIDPPKIAGGLVARVHNYLELHFHFRSSQIEGFSEILEKN